MGNIDPYLLHAFDTADQQAIVEVNEGRRSPHTPVRLPMLARVDDDFWRREFVPDLEITSRIGNFLSGSGSRETLRDLHEDPSVIAVEGGRRALPFETANSIPYVKATSARGVHGEDGSECIVAVIDDGIDVLHEAFQDDTGRTRILAIWDQSDPTGPSPSFTYASGLNAQTVIYGTVHTKAEIDSYINSGNAPPRLSRNIGDHGTHVASIAAGRSVGQFDGGVAPGAMLLIVIPRLKAGQEDPLSIGYSTSHVDALAFITHFARTYSADQGRKRSLPVVVNVSQGMNAGAHDGTSLLEAAFDQFSDTGRSPGLVIVKSAGNTRDKDIHAKLALAPDDVDQLQWDQPDEPHPGPDILELWFNASDDFTFSIIDPQVQELKTKASWTLPSVSGAFPSGNTADLEFTRYHHDNGDSRFQVTVRRGTRQAVLGGTWTLTIKSRRVPLGGEIHAWLERDDSSRVQFMNHINEEMTLSIPGTARSVICVAAVDTTSQPGAVKTPHYSAYGRTRDDRRKPDLAAPGQAVYAAEAGTGNGAVPKSGTSMAAPHVTGAVALLLSCWAKNQPTRSQLTANQVRAALCQGAQSFNPAWNRGRGYGILDAQSLLAAFL